MLHIITPLFRFENLDKIYNSILMNTDIRWHISYSHERELPNLEFLSSDSRVITHKVECSDNEAFAKRNSVLEKINDGYFCFLDDDTVFHENMYMKYLDSMENNFVGMIVGIQLGYDNNIRLFPSKPIYERIDVGNVLSHYSVLKHVRYPESHIPNMNNKDFLFWKSVYEYFGERCTLVNIPISHYNKISGRDEMRFINKKTGKIKKTKVTE